MGRAARADGLPSVESLERLIGRGSHETWREAGCRLGTYSIVRMDGCDGHRAIRRGDK
jgi:hypothetical protein